MFVPRALRLKGVQEPQRPRTAKATPDLTPPPLQTVTKHGSRGPIFTTKPVTPDYVAQLAAGIELIFSDYAHQEEVRSEWLQARYRRVDGEDKFIHLTAILDHPYISSLKPEASQKLLQDALQTHPSALLETSTNGYYVRRKPASYPPKFLPDLSFAECDDHGLTFWDQRTIYVEPHLRNMCSTPAKVAHWLKAHGQLRSKWLPVQAVHTLWNSCAFVVLSGSVMHDNVWSKWRAAEKPSDWKIMTKVEHTKRTAEDVALLEQQNPRGMRKTIVDELKLPPIARPATLPLDTVILPEYSEAKEKPAGKRKRKRKKSNKSGHGDENARPDKTDHGAKEPNVEQLSGEDVQSEQPNHKRRG